MPQSKWSVFISHAHEDKESIARPLALALMRRGLSVWFDEFSLKPGDSLSQSIDQGLSQSRFGIVIISPNFLAKKWPQKEFSALHTKQLAGDQKVLIPLWHEIEAEEVRSHSSILADTVALKTSRPLPEIIDKILAEVHFSQGTANVTENVPTGIHGLDHALCGGFPRPSSVLIYGPKGIGKTTLALQIQIAALDRGESGLYITYRETPPDIIRYMRRLGAPVADYVSMGKFKIFDNHSALHSISKKDIESSLPPELHKAIVRVPDPQDVEAYLELQAAVIEEIGAGGVNVIDSVNERYRLLPTGRDTSRYFERFRAKLGRLGGQTAIHIATDDIQDAEFNSLLRNLQDGEIRLTQREEPEPSRVLQITNLRGTAYDQRAIEYTITENGVVVIGPVE